ncbi:hypothetical protein ACJ8LR_24040 [Serratia sp. CY56810]|uniref:hypothetical protein n=1 Tax=Serratia sp. CY56810 TaxID=3383642 RepID=UPI003F9FD0C0
MTGLLAGFYGGHAQQLSSSAAQQLSSSAAQQLSSSAAQQLSSSAAQGRLLLSSIWGSVILSACEIPHCKKIQWLLTSSIVVAIMHKNNKICHY